ncbi:hypothetical protein [Pedobacter deserti]|uniref:hypothetical protein n=1 Tax=Pedobacter deserti TaxID=2817382 RepID=UPI00210E689E|nr:hypothetical protein [Pedobacter sp. SYSU D00382]
MKKQSILTIALLLIVNLVLTSCGKEDTTSIKPRMTGRWDVSRIEGVPLNISTGDYYDFKEGEDDIVEIREGGNLQSGTYAVQVGNDFTMQIGGKLYTCTVIVLETGRLEFSASDGSVTKKVFLKR